MITWLDTEVEVEIEGEEAAVMANPEGQFQMDQLEFELHEREKCLEP